MNSTEVIVFGDSLDDVNIDEDGGAGGSVVCGNDIVEPTEECDDGNTVDGDGCSGDCKFQCTETDRGIDPYFEGVTIGVENNQIVTRDDSCTHNFNTKEYYCDGINIKEKNFTCSGGCYLSQGVLCHGDISPTPQICGDGILASGEECDDGNTVDGDGCSGECMNEVVTNVCLMMSMSSMTSGCENSGYEWDSCLGAVIDPDPCFTNVTTADLCYASEDFFPDSTKIFCSNACEQGNCI